jgi:TolA-binding protein
MSDSMDVIRKTREVAIHDIEFAMKELRVRRETIEEQLAQLAAELERLRDYGRTQTGRLTREAAKDQNLRVGKAVYAFLEREGGWRSHSEIAANVPVSDERVWRHWVRMREVYNTAHPKQQILDNGAVKKHRKYSAQK